MATIIEVQDTKLETLTEYVEKMLTYGSKLMHCLEDVKDNRYEEKQGRRKDMYRYPREEYRDSDYNRYY